MINTVPFADVLKDVSAGNKKIPQSEFLPDGQLPIVDQGQSLVAGFTEDRSAAVRSIAPVIVFGDHTRAIKFIDFPFAMGADGVKVLQVRDGFDPKFVYHFLKSRHIPNAGYSRHFKYLKEVEVPSPPLPEQRRIAAILDHVDALRARRSEQLAHLDALAQSIFISLFGDGSSSRSKTTIVCLEDVVERITYGFTNPMSHVSAGIPIVTAKSVRNQGIDLVGGAFTTRDEFNALTDKSRPRKGDVLITKDGTIGRCAVVDTTEPFCINQSVAVVRPRQDLRPRYLVGYLTLSRVQRLMNGMGKGNALKHLQITELAKFSIPVPAVEEQSRYESQMAIVDFHRAALRRSMVAGNELFESLESRAFRGEL